ncbi:MAG: peptidylprolyl isomerase [Fibrobacteraceae bacterium]|nr:peptidylprolyl isomerase [Fibrobacteraceae bacterium]
MQIAHQTVVQMHYTLKDDNGNTIDSSVGKEPLEYIQGLGMIVPGLEKAMVGKSVGDKFEVVVLPAEGYGEYNKGLVSEIPKTAFQGDDVQVGMTFYAQTPNGILPIRILEVKEDKVTVDANHELAGKNLNFAIEVVSVRQATEKELESLQHHHCHCHDHEDEHECCGGKGHGEGHECCGGKNHGEGHECCGGKNHGEGHECCGGKNQDKDHECCCKNK